MKALILCGHSDVNSELNALTQPVREAYAARHGYATVTYNIPWEEWKLEGLRLVRKHLASFDLVMAVGADVLFTNHTIPLEGFLDYGVDLTVARENLGWWPINNDVAIWQGPGNHTLDRIIADADKWLQYPWLWQNHLWNLIQTEEVIRSLVRVVEGRVMNSLPVAGASRWQLGDWILHCMDGSPPGQSLQRKIQLVKTYLPFVGDGTFYPASLKHYPAAT